jgi:hypothetical protein
MAPLGDSFEPMAIIVLTDGAHALDLDNVRKRDRPAIVVALIQKNRSTLQRSELTQELPFLWAAFRRPCCQKNSVVNYNKGST